MNSELFGSLLALASGLIWGGGDFAGGVASRKSSSMQVLVIGGAAGFGLLVLLALLWREPFPSPRSLGWGFVAGLFGMLGLVCLYHGLANGRASVVAPVSTIVAQAVPVLFVAVSTGLPAVSQLIGFVLAIAGVWLVSQSPETDDGRASRSSGLNMALLAGLGFGLFFIFAGFTESAHVFGALAAARVATVGGCLLLLLARREGIGRAAIRPVALLSGTLDAIGNALYLVAKQFVRQDVAVVLSSLYPISTILLSYLIFKERIVARQWAGIAVCSVAVVLIVADAALWRRWLGA